MSVDKLNAITKDVGDSSGAFVAAGGEAYDWGVVFS